MTLGPEIYRGPDWSLTELVVVMRDEAGESCGAVTIELEWMATGNALDYSVFFCAAGQHLARECVERKRRLEHAGRFTPQMDGTLFFIFDDEFWPQQQQQRQQQQMLADQIQALVGAPVPSADLDEPGGVDAAVKPGMLTIDLSTCRSLVPADRSGLSDPYVVVSLGHETASSAIIMDTVNPDFDEALRLRVDPAQHTPLTRLRLEVFSEDADRDDHFLGEVEISLEALLRGDTPSLRKQVYLLGDPSGRVSALDLRRQMRKLRSSSSNALSATTSGSHSAVQSPATAADQPGSPQISSTAKESQQQPQSTYGTIELGASFVLDGVRHPPGDGTVFISLIDANGLVPGLSSTCNPYAKVTMPGPAARAASDTVAHATRSGIDSQTHTHRTQTRANTSEPVFNELCHFELHSAETTDWEVTVEIWDDQSPAADLYLGECRLRMRDEFASAGTESWETASIERRWRLSDPLSRISTERLKRHLSSSLGSEHHHQQKSRSAGPYGTVRLKLGFALSGDAGGLAAAGVSSEGQSHEQRQNHEQRAWTPYGDRLSGVWHAMGSSTNSAEGEPPLEEFLVLRQDSNGVIRGNDLGGAKDSDEASFTLRDSALVPSNGGKSTLSFMQVYDDGADRMQWKAELQSDGGRTVLVGGTWHNPDDSLYEGVFHAVRLTNRRVKHFHFELELRQSTSSELEAGLPWPAQRQIPRTSSEVSANSLSSLRSMAMELSASSFGAEGATLYDASSAIDDGTGMALGDVTAAADGDVVAVELSNQTMLELLIFADHLPSLTTRQVGCLKPSATATFPGLCPGQTVLRAVAAGGPKTKNDVVAGTDLWEVRVPGLDSVEDDDEGSAEQESTLSSCHSYEIKQPITSPAHTPVFAACVDSVRELLESIVYREHRVDALSKLVELSEGVNGTGHKNDSSGNGSEPRQQDQQQEDEEHSRRLKLRVGLAFAECDGFCILLPLLCHPDPQLWLGALDLVASVCDLPSNRKHVTHLLGRLVEMIPSCGSQEALVAVIMALDSACRDHPANCQLVGAQLQDGLACGDMAVAVLASFLKVCDGSRLGMPAQMLLRRAKVNTAAQATAELSEAGEEHWIGELQALGWTRLSAEGPQPSHLGRTVYSSRYGEGSLFDFDSLSLNIDFDISGSKTIPISAVAAAHDPEDQPDTSETEEVLLISPAVLTQPPVWEQRGGQSSTVRRNPRVARAEDVAAWMVKQGATGLGSQKDGRVCEFYAGVLYRRGVNGKMLISMTETTLAELGMLNEGHIAAVFNRCVALKGFLSRYIVEEGPSIYESKETRVIRALDRLSSASGRRGMGQQVALKLLNSPTAFERELRARSQLASGVAVPLLRVHVPSRYRWPPGSTVPPILTDLSRTADLDTDSSVLDKRLGGQYVLVFECADFNLETFFSSQSKKGPVDLPEARDVLSAAASRLQQCEAAGLVHGDVSLANFVSKSGTRSGYEYTLMWIESHERNASNHN